MKKTFAILFLTLGLGIIGCNSSQEKDDDILIDFWESRQEPPLFKERLQEVENKIANMKHLYNEAWQNAYFWAGRYEFSHDHGFAVLSLAPDVGYVLEESSRHFETDCRYGTVNWVWHTQTIVLDGGSHYPLEYKPIRWGERLYLIPTSRIIEFCYSVNQGKEPRNDQGWGVFLLRHGDWEKEVEGKPEVPEEFEKYLLDEPVVATLVSIPRTEDDSSFGKIAIAVLDKGAKDGLQPGMRLIAEDREGSGYPSVTLTKVEETQSEGKLHFSANPGQQFSTYPKWMWRMNNRVQDASP